MTHSKSPNETIITPRYLCRNKIDPVEDNIYFSSIIYLIYPSLAWNKQAMVTGSDKAIALLLQQKESSIKKTAGWQMYVGESGSSDRDRWYKYTHDNADPSKI